MSAVAVAIGVGAAATIGAGYMSSQSQKEASGKARDQANAQMIFNQMRNDQNTGRLQPYMNMGDQGLGQLANYDLMEGVGPEVSYDTEYTNKLKDYESSPAFEAQNMLGQQALSRASSARGLAGGRSAANAQGELTQKLIASDYDKYRGDLGQRYKALQGEYGLRRENNQNRYKQLMDQVGIGQWGLGNKLNIDAGLGAANAQQSANITAANQAQSNADQKFYQQTGSAISSAAGGMSGAGGLGSMFSGASTPGANMSSANTGFSTGAITSGGKVV